MSTPRIVHARNPRRIRNTPPTKFAAKAPVKLGDVIVRPKRRAAPPVEDVDAAARGDAAQRLWLELMQRTEEAAGKAK